jgi:hypothetical protein
LEPKEGDALIGDQGAVLNGSKVLGGWRKIGSVWSTAGFLPPAPSNHGQCLESVPTCGYTEHVFVDKKRLNRVDSPSAVTAGTVHADYRSNIIPIGDDPRRHLVEHAVASQLVRAPVDDVTVANFILEQAANEASSRCCGEPRQAPQGGHQLADPPQRRAPQPRLRPRFRRCRKLHPPPRSTGLRRLGTGSVLSNNEISFNDAAGYPPEGEAGGSKSWLTEHQTLTHNYVHDNQGPGPVGRRGQHGHVL